MHSETIPKTCIIQIGKLLELCIALTSNCYGDDVIRQRPWRRPGTKLMTVDYPSNDDDKIREIPRENLINLCRKTR